MKKNTIIKKSLKVFIVGIFVLFIAGTVFSNTAQPTRFTVNFTDAHLIFMPNSLSMQIITENNVLSYGENWEIKQLKPYLFHLKLRSWQGFYWQLNTSRKEVHIVRNNQFGTIGGDKTKLPILVTPSNNNFKLIFSNSYLVYFPNTGTLQIVAEGNVLSYGSNWTVVKKKPYLYHMKKNSWQGFFWQINTSRKELSLIRGTIGSYEGERTMKNATIIPYY